MRLVVCSRDDLPAGTSQTASSGSLEVVVVNVDGELYAIDNACSHTGGPLAGGLVRDGSITCPLHWWRYDLATGRRRGAPHIRQQTYPVAVDGDDVVVDVPEPEPATGMRELLLRHAAEWKATRDAAEDAPEIVAVIWDMGGILYMTPFEAFGDMERDLGLRPGVLGRGPFAPGGDPEYAKISTGELTEGEYFTTFMEHAESVGAPADLLDRIDWADRLRPEVMAAIDRIDGHYVQATLSNDSSRWLGDNWWETWPHRHKFASVIDVKMLGVRKPDPEPYLASAKDLGMLPEECLFIDDMQQNVAGAEAVGMHGFFFDHTDVAGSLDRLFVRLGIEEDWRT